MLITTHLMAAYVQKLIFEDISLRANHEELSRGTYLEARTSGRTFTLPITVRGYLCGQPLPVLSLSIVTV